MDIRNSLDSLLPLSGELQASALERIDISDQGVMLVDAAMKICFWSDWLSEWTGVASTQAKGKCYRSVYGL